MSTKAAGWYPDPSGENRQRFWDGDSWTEYYTPLPPEAATTYGAETAHEDYPYLAQVSSIQTLAPPTIQALDPWGLGASSQPEVAAADGGAPRREFGARTRSTHRSAVISAVLLVAILVGLLIYAVLRPSSPSSPGTATTPDDVETTFDVTQVTTGHVPPAGALWAGEFTVTETTDLILDIVGESDGVDMYARLVGPGGREILRADDRGEMTQAIGGGVLDPLVFTRIEAGTYTLQVMDHSAIGADITIRPLAPEGSITGTGEISGRIPGLDPLLVTWDATSAETFTIAVEDGHATDPMLFVYGADGTFLSHDDRDNAGGDLRPELTMEAHDQPYLLMVWTWNGDTADVDVIVNPGH